jgi:uncharacterized protein (DUF2249 family)
MELQLDVSGLEPPEPLERILDALDQLAAGDCLRARLRREPFPLYGFLQRLGYAWRTERTGEVAYEVLIWPVAASPPGRPVTPPC